MQAGAFGRGLLLGQKVQQAGAIPQLGQRVEHGLALRATQCCAQLFGLARAVAQAQIALHQLCHVAQLAPLAGI